MRPDVLERHVALRLLVYLGILIAVLYAGGMIWGVVAHYQDVILLLFLAWIVAFVLHPLASLVQRPWVPRWLAVSAIYALLLLLAVASILLTIPLMRVQVTHLAGALTAAFSPANVRALGAWVAVFLQSLGLSARDAHDLVDQVVAKAPSVMGQLTNHVVTSVQSLVGTAMTLVFDAIFVAIMSFYMTLDGDRLVESLVVKLPPHWVEDVRIFQRHVECIFGGFLRAALIIGAVYAALNWVVLAALGQPGALIFALLAGILLMVPLIGSFLAVLPPILVIGLQSPSSVLLRNLVIVVVALVIVQQLTMQLLAPRVMSAHVGLHPIVFFIALLVGTKEAGFWGILFSGPIAALIVAVVDTFFDRWRVASGLYPELAGHPDGMRGGAAPELEATGPRELMGSGARDGRA